MAKFQFMGEGELWSQNLKYSKSQEMAKFQFLEEVTLEWTQILLFEECVHKPACASQIVSHILRMWRLIRV